MVDYVITEHALFQMQRRGISESECGLGMKITYDPNTDTMTIILKESVVAESDEEKKGIIIDYDDDGDMVSLEILDAKKRITQPTQLVYELADQAVEPGTR